MADKIPSADHHQACKFENVFSPEFTMVVSRLQALQRALNIRALVDSPSAAMEEDASSDAAQGAPASRRRDDSSRSPS